jgi:hypothetical protein
MHSTEPRNKPWSAAWPEELMISTEVQTYRMTFSRLPYFPILGSKVDPIFQAAGFVARQELALKLALLRIAYFPPVGIDKTAR